MADSTVSEFFKFSNPLFLDVFVAIVLYALARILAWRGFPRIAEGVREASLVFLVFMFYDMSRYFALDEEAKALANGRKVIKFEKDTHINIEKSLIKFAMDHEEFGKFLNHFYLGAHWGGLVIFFVWAYARVIFASQNKMQRRRKEYVQFRGRFILMNIVAAISFMLYPCAPPRLLGYGDTLKDLGKTDVYTGTRRWVNPYAAMPSMHQGYSLLFAATIVIMLRSEILAQASGVEPDEEDDDLEMGNNPNDKLQDTPSSGLRSALTQLRARYQQYRVLSYATRSNSSKLFYISLLPLVFLGYPLFMFVVIVSTGNHFVLDAIAGAGAMGLAALMYPIVLRLVLAVRDTIARMGQFLLSFIGAKAFGVQKDMVELSDVKEKDKEEKKGFLADPPADV